MPTRANWTPHYLLLKPGWQAMRQTGEEGSRPTGQGGHPPLAHGSEASTSVVRAAIHPGVGQHLSSCHRSSRLQATASQSTHSCRALNHLCCGAGRQPWRHPRIRPSLLEAGRVHESDWPSKPPLLLLPQGAQHAAGGHRGLLPKAKLQGLLQGLLRGRASTSVDVLQRLQGGQAAGASHQCCMRRGMKALKARCSA